jgi:hypothetical protein
MREPPFFAPVCLLSSYLIAAIKTVAVLRQVFFFALVPSLSWQNDTRFLNIC